MGSGAGSGPPIAATLAQARSPSPSTEVPYGMRLSNAPERPRGIYRYELIDGHPRGKARQNAEFYAKRLDFGIELLHRAASRKFELEIFHALAREERCKRRAFPRAVSHFRDRRHLELALEARPAGKLARNFYFTAFFTQSHAKEHRRAREQIWQA